MKENLLGKTLCCLSLGTAATLFVGSWTYALTNYERLRNNEEPTRQESGLEQEIINYDVSC